MNIVDGSIAAFLESRGDHVAEWFAWLTVWNGLRGSWNIQIRFFLDFGCVALEGSRQGFERHEDSAVCRVSLCGSWQFWWSDRAWLGGGGTVKEFAEQGGVRSARVWFLARFVVLPNNLGLRDGYDGYAGEVFQVAFCMNAFHRDDSVSVTSASICRVEKTPERMIGRTGCAGGVEFADFSDCLRWRIFCCSKMQRALSPMFDSETCQNSGHLPSMAWRNAQ